MQSPSTDNRIVLVRAPIARLSTAGLAAAVNGVLDECTGAVRVFLHGPGLEHVIGDNRRYWPRQLAGSRLRIQVCAAAWRRRGEGEPPEGVARSSLVQMWQRLLRGDHLICFGAGDGC